jgi:hypothetical protein
VCLVVCLIARAGALRDALDKPNIVMLFVDVRETLRLPLLAFNLFVLSLL